MKRSIIKYRKQMNVDAQFHSTKKNRSEAAHKKIYE